MISNRGNEGNILSIDAKKKEEMSNFFKLIFPVLKSFSYKSNQYSDRLPDEIKLHIFYKFISVSFSNVSLDKIQSLTSLISNLFSYIEEVKINDIDRFNSLTIDNFFEKYLSYLNRESLKIINDFNPYELSTVDIIKIKNRYIEIDRLDVFEKQIEAYKVKLEAVARSSEGWGFNRLTEICPFEIYELDSALIIWPVVKEYFQATFNDFYQAIEAHLQETKANNIAREQLKKFFVDSLQYFKLLKDQSREDIEMFPGVFRGVLSLAMKTMPNYRLDHDELIRHMMDVFPILEKNHPDDIHTLTGEQFLQYYLGYLKEKLAEAIRDKSSRKILEIKNQYAEMCSLALFYKEITPQMNDLKLLGKPWYLNHKQNLLADFNNELFYFLPLLSDNIRNSVLKEIFTLYSAPEYQEIIEKFHDSYPDYFKAWLLNTKQLSMGMGTGLMIFLAKSSIDKKSFFTDYQLANFIGRLIQLFIFYPRRENAEFYKNCILAFQELIKLGAKLDKVLIDEKYHNPFHYLIDSIHALNKGSLKSSMTSFKSLKFVVQLLIEQGADVEFLNDKGNTPLKEAILKNLETLSLVFIELNAKVKYLWKENLLTIAKENKMDKVCDALLARDPSLALVSDKPTTGLQFFGVQSVTVNDTDNKAEVKPYDDAEEEAELKDFEDFNEFVIIAPSNANPNASSTEKSNSLSTKLSQNLIGTVFNLVKNNKRNKNNKVSNNDSLPDDKNKNNKRKKEK